MALYTQRRRRTRVRSAWIGGPFVAPSTDVDASGGVATFGGGTATLTITPPAAANGVATFGGGTATFRPTYTASSGAATYAGGVASVSVSVTLTATGGQAAFAGGTATYAPASSAASGLATFAGGVASVTVSVTLTAAGGAATFGGGTATYGEARQSLLPGIRTRAAPGLALGYGRRTYRRREFRRWWIGTSSAPPVELTAENGQATFGGGTASIGEALTATGGQTTFTGGTATVAVSLSAAGGVATFSGDTATYSEGTPTRSLLPGRQTRAAPGLSLGHRRYAVRPDRRRRWIGSIVRTTVDLSAENGLATFAGGDATVAVSRASLLVGAPRMRAATGLASGRAPNRKPLRGYRRRWVGTTGAPVVTITLVAAGEPIIGPPPLGDHWTQLEFKGGAAAASSEVVGGTLNLTAAAGLVSFTGGTASASIDLGEIPETHPVTGGVFDEGATGGVFSETSTGGTVTEPSRGGVVVTYTRGGVVTEPSRGGVVDESVRAGADDSLTGGVFSESSTGGTVVTYVRGGTVQEPARGGTLPGVRSGTVDEPVRAGVVDEPVRSGDVEEPSRGGIYDEAATGGEVL